MSQKLVRGWSSRGEAVAHAAWLGGLAAGILLFPHPFLSGAASQQGMTFIEGVGALLRVGLVALSAPAMGVSVSALSAWVAVSGSRRERPAGSRLVLAAATGALCTVALVAVLYMAVGPLLRVYFPALMAVEPGVLMGAVGFFGFFTTLSGLALEASSARKRVRAAAAHVCGPACQPAAAMVPGADPYAVPEAGCPIVHHGDGDDAA